MRNGKYSTIEPRKGIIFREKDVCSVSAAGVGFIEESCIGVCTWDHVTSTIYYTIVGIGGNIVKE